MSATFTSGSLSITVESNLALMMIYLRDRVAESQMFRAIVANPLAEYADVKAWIATEGTPDLTNAYAAIKYERWDDENWNQSDAQCLLRPIDDEDMDNIGTRNWDISNTVVMQLECPVPTALRANSDVSAIDFWEKISTIIDQIRIPSAPSNRIEITDIRRGPTGQIRPDDSDGAIVRVVNYFLKIGGGD